jgi:hypothetical protein
MTNADRQDAYRTLTMELVNALAPERSRTSCSDVDPSAGTYANGTPRCTRCGLLAAKNGDLEPGVTMTVTFEVEQ